MIRVYTGIDWLLVICTMAHGFVFLVLVGWQKFCFVGGMRGDERMHGRCLYLGESHDSMCPLPKSWLLSLDSIFG